MKERNTSVLYIGMFLALVFMLGAMTQQRLNETETIVLANEPSLIEDSSGGMEHGSVIEPDEPVGVEDMGIVVPVIALTPAEQYVKDKFGDNYEEAFKIIKCESNWNTKAFNNNETWGGLGQDRGLWQINNMYHPISDECAYDYKCATDYSFRMYQNDNQSFVRWTCGKK